MICLVFLRGDPYPSFFIFYFFYHFSYFYVGFHFFCLLPPSAPSLDPNLQALKYDLTFAAVKWKKRIKGQLPFGEEINLREKREIRVERRKRKWYRRNYFTYSFVLFVLSSLIHCMYTTCTCYAHRFELNQKISEICEFFSVMCMWCAYGVHGYILIWEAVMFTSYDACMLCPGI